MPQLTWPAGCSLQETAQTTGLDASKQGLAQGAQPADAGGGALTHGRVALMARGNAQASPKLLHLLDGWSCSRLRWTVRG